MLWNNLYIMGSSHIAKESVEEVEKLVTTWQPDIIALELDRDRFRSLFSKHKQKPSLKHIRRVGFKGFLFLLLGELAERKMGDMVGTKPGAEMRKATRLAKEHGIRLVLIDQHIETTLKNFSKTLTWKEKGRFLADVVKAAYKREKLPFDLNAVPDQKTVTKLITQVKDRYPNVYTSLIDDRNQVMAKRLAYLIRDDPSKKILAVMGAGHVKEVMRLTKKRLSH